MRRLFVGVALAVLACGGDSTGPDGEPTLVGTWGYAASALGIDSLFTGTVRVDSVAETTEIHGRWNVAGFNPVADRDGSGPGIGFANRTEGNFALHSTGAGFFGVTIVRILADGTADCQEFRFIESLEDISVGACSMTRR